MLTLDPHRHAQDRVAGDLSLAERAFLTRMAELCAIGRTNTAVLASTVREKAADAGLDLALSVVEEAISATLGTRCNATSEPSRRTAPTTVAGPGCDVSSLPSVAPTPTWLSSLEAATTTTENATAGDPLSHVGLEVKEDRTRAHTPHDRDDRDETAARLRTLGISAARRRRVRCILPGHDGHSARVYRMPAGHFDYDCSALDSTIGLAEVRASIGHGAVRRPQGFQAHVWLARLDFEAGLNKPPAIEARLPSARPDSAIRFADGLVLYVRLSRLYPEWPDEFLFTRDFSRGWCGLTDEQAKRGRRLAERHGLIVKVGTKGLPTGPANLYRPGPALVVASAP